MRRLRNRPERAGRGSLKNIMFREVKSAASGAGLACLVLAGCGGEDITEFEGYGTAMPGSGLEVEGGEALLEKVFLSPGMTGGQAVEVNWFYSFAFDGGFDGAESGPAPGECYEFDHPTSFPVHDIPAETEYVDLGDAITLSGPGVPGGSIDVEKVVTEGEEPRIDNRPSPIRSHDEGNWIYGGPRWQDGDFQNVDLQEGYYEIDFGDEQRELYFPPAYDFALNAGREDVVLPEPGDDGLELTWEEIPNPDSAHGHEHSFVFVNFAAFPDEEEGDLGPTPLYMCQPDDTEDGQIVIPNEVIEDLPDEGIFQTGRLTHYFDTLDGERRFDLFAIYCAISAYEKEGAGDDNGDNNGDNDNGDNDNGDN